MLSFIFSFLGVWPLAEYGKQKELPKDFPNLLATLDLLYVLFGAWICCFLFLIYFPTLLNAV
jgi:hypothetical protein